jgi:hypothetical protein
MDLKTLYDTPPWDWPEDAAEIFLGVLRDGRADESDRLLAAEMAGSFTVMNDELATALLSIATNGKESASLRKESVIALGPVLDYADTEGFEDPDEVPISEETFRTVQGALRELYTDADVPKNVRRGALEASVRAQEHWHPDAIRAAYSSGDGSWMLTAVFCMGFVRGFDDQIIEALASKNEDIHYQAVCAAGNWELDAAWPHIAGLVTSKGTDKPLLLAAIDAIAAIRPEEATDILVPLLDSTDEDIVEAVHEALAMAEENWDDEDDEDESFY